MQLSAIDRRILNSIQEDIPLETEPFKKISRSLGIEEEEFLDRVKRMKKEGIIRTFAAGLSHRKLGYKGTLIAVRLPENEIETLAAELVAEPQVTHCYMREGEFNLYFVLICSSQDEINKFVDDLAGNVGRENIRNLTTKKQFKLKTRFKI